MVVNNMRRNDFIKPLTHELLKNVESEIKDFVGTDIYSFTREHSKYDEKYEKIKELLYVRQSLLDKIFLATPEEINRLEQVNSLLKEYMAETAWQDRLLIEKQGLNKLPLDALYK